MISASPGKGPSGLVISLRELGQHSASPTDLVSAAGCDFELLQRRLDPLVRVEWAAGGAVDLKAGYAVGSLRVGRLRIDVQPRLSGPLFVAFVRYALGGSVTSRERAEPISDKVGLDELFGHLLAEELAEVRQRGLSRQYISRLDRTGTLRGRPAFLESFPWDERGRTALSCRYHELTYDTLDNRLIHAGLQHALLLELTPNTRRRLCDHRHAWTELASSTSPSPSQFALCRQRYTRHTQHYRLAHNVSEALVLSRRASDLFAPANQVSGGLVIAMPALYEIFCERLLREALAPVGIEVLSQASDRQALVDAVGVSYRSVRPDLILMASGRPLAVLDAKYKDYANADANGKPCRKIENADLYQLFFYAQRLAQKHRLAALPDGHIVCPALPEVPLVSDRYRRVSYRAGATVEAVAHLLPLPLEDLLRDLRAFPARAQKRVRDMLGGPAGLCLTDRPCAA